MTKPMGLVLAFVSVFAVGHSVDAIQPDDVIKRGAPIGDSPVVKARDVVENVDRFSDQTVIVEGEIGEVCQTKGCWMALVPDGVTTKIRVTFKDYGFFVPKDCTGLEARLEGTFHTSVLSKDDADHLEGEGARLKRNPDGTATELSFVASGVELHQKMESR